MIVKGLVAEKRNNLQETSARAREGRGLGRFGSLRLKYVSRYVGAYGMINYILILISASPLAEK